ncbi:unnamed protein product [Owenia fusiformis]|uniref:NADH dehydrogenase [ubiquinone] 1 alpha subcomplex subunit 8 n=1 Tax=Owenia fusiformis TaxID=6347 RepID=A0A8J1UC29_OWEFU|nr:unnamed protein product [Owenia fusiformis]
MVITSDTWLPSHEELTVPELELSSGVLRAGAHHFGKYCDFQSKEFMLCWREEKDPRKCINEGKEVTNCGFEFFGEVKKHCMDSFTKYWNCIDNAGTRMHYDRCRETQAAFDKCVLANLKQERPDLGYFSKVRVHHTKRPKPVEPSHKYPEPTPDMPDFKNEPMPDSVKYGNRFFFN